MLTMYCLSILFVLVYFVTAMCLLSTSQILMPPIIFPYCELVSVSLSLKLTRLVILCIKSK